MDHDHTKEAVVREAFHYRDALICHAHSILKDWSMAEDVVQEAYLTVCDKWQDFSPGTNLLAWVRRIVYFKAMEALRSRNNTTPVEQTALEKTVSKLLESRLNEERAHYLQRRRLWLQECLMQLNQRSVKMLTDYYWNGMTGEALSLKYKRSVNAMRLTLMRLRKRLRQCIASQELSYDA